MNSAFGVGDFISWGDGNEMVGRRRGGQFLPRPSRLRIDAEKKKVRQELSSGTPGAECRDVRGLSPATPGAELSDASASPRRAPGLALGAPAGFVLYASPEPPPAVHICTQVLIGSISICLPILLSVYPSVQGGGDVEPLPPTPATPSPKGY